MKDEDKQEEEDPKEYIRRAVKKDPSILDRLSPLERVVAEAVCHTP